MALKRIGLLLLLTTIGVKKIKELSPIPRQPLMVQRGQSLLRPIIPLLDAKPAVIYRYASFSDDSVMPQWKFHKLLNVLYLRPEKW